MRPYPSSRARPGGPATILESLAHRLGQWADFALCRGMDPNDFYPPVYRGGSRKAVEHTKKARATCEACPVREACLEFALDNFEHGIWGGTDETERVAMRLKRRTRG